VIFFIDGGLTHGATAWKNPLPRRGILMKYSGREVHRSGGDLVHPEARWGDLVEGMTDAQLAVMRGPDRDAAAVNVPRLGKHTSNLQLLVVQRDLLTGCLRLQRCKQTEGLV